MNRVVMLATAMALSVGLAACETKQQKVANKEDMLAASGFKFVPANTPQRQASFKTLPPYKFIQWDGKLVRETIDEMVMKALTQKDNVQNSFQDELKKHIKEIIAAAKKS